MNKKLQSNIVNDLCDSIKKDMLATIRNGRVPENWNGLELRQWLANKAAGNVVMMDRPRMREFNNDCLIHNL